MKRKCWVVFRAGSNLDNLSILPTSGTKYFRYSDGWQKLYSDDLSDAEKKKIEGALEEAVAESGFQPAQSWGERIEDRGTQITYSALGQQAPLEEKSKWDPDFAKRKQIKAILDKTLPEFSVRLGGTTSIDVTRPGIDKAYGIRKLRDVLGVPIAQMLFVGDALFPGGNDYPAIEAGVESIEVRDPDEIETGYRNDRCLPELTEAVNAIVWRDSIREADPDRGRLRTRY